MIEINGTTITMTRADTFRAVVGIFNEDGSVYEPQEGDSVRFALKKDYNDSEVVILKDIPIDTLLLELEPSDTKSLPQPSSWVYDIQLTTASGLVDTFINKAKFKISEEVE